MSDNSYLHVFSSSYPYLLGIQPKSPFSSLGVDSLSSHIQETSHLYFLGIQIRILCNWNFLDFFYFQGANTKSPSCPIHLEILCKILSVYLLSGLIPECTNVRLFVSFLGTQHRPSFIWLLSGLFTESTHSGLFLPFPLRNQP